MERHAFDGVSFFFGLVFVTLASWVLLTEGRLDFVEARWLWPVLLVIGGVALVVPAFRRGGTAEPAAPVPETARNQAELEAARAELPPDPFGSES